MRLDLEWFFWMSQAVLTVLETRKGVAFLADLSP